MRRDLLEVAGRSRSFWAIGDSRIGKRHYSYNCFILAIASTELIEEPRSRTTVYLEEEYL